MTTIQPVSASDSSALPRARTTLPDASRAALTRAVLLHALALGVAGDLLLRFGFVGLGFPLWIALVALGALSLANRSDRFLPRETAGWLATAIGFASAMAWRDAEHLQAFDFLAVLLALGMSAVSLGAPRLALFAPRIRDTVWAGAAEIFSIAAGPAPLLFSGMALPAPQPAMRGRLRSAVRATLIALPLLIVFGALLRDADPVFASLLALPDLDIETLVSHVALIGFFTWIVAGWARGALLADLGRRRAPDRLPISLEMLDVTAALGALIALFAAYVATQLGWFFGGEAFLQARTGLTAAGYARQGFFQMVVVVVLVVPVLLGTRAAMQPGEAIERRHTMLSLPLLVLLGAMIVSAVLRMRLYVHYYGLTVERLDTLVFMGWLAVVLAWFALTVLRGRGRFFAAGAVVSGLATLALLNVVSPDRIVARVDIARSASGAPGTRPPLDLQHLASLSGEAVPLAVAAVLAPPPVLVDSAANAHAKRDRCVASGRLLSRRPSALEAGQRELHDAAWRRWNWGEARAEEVVAANAQALLNVQRASCPPRLPPSVRPRASEPAGR
jgi:hypothetical protein